MGGGHGAPKMQVISIFNCDFENLFGVHDLVAGNISDCDF